MPIKRGWIKKEKTENSDNLDSTKGKGHEPSFFILRIVGVRLQNKDYVAHIVWILSAQIGADQKVLEW